MAESQGSLHAYTKISSGMQLIVVLTVVLRFLYPAFLLSLSLTTKGRITTSTPHRRSVALEKDPNRHHPACPIHHHVFNGFQRSSSTSYTLQRHFRRTNYLVTYHLVYLASLSNNSCRIQIFVLAVLKSKSHSSIITKFISIVPRADNGPNPAYLMHL